MPTQSQLRSLGRLYLWRGIAQHGGATAVAKRLGWKVILKPYKFWKSFEHLERELIAFIEVRNRLETKAILIPVFFL